MYDKGRSMSNLQFHQVSLDALALVSDNGKHLTRALSFADGHHKLLGCIVGNNTPIKLATDQVSSVRFEITQGGGEVVIDNSEPHYYREGQTFLAVAGADVTITSESVVQYVRHLEG